MIEYFHTQKKIYKKLLVYFLFYFLQLPPTVISNSEKFTHPIVQCPVSVILGVGTQGAHQAPTPPLVQIGNSVCMNDICV